MEILGIGPLELFFIVIIALIVLGPKDMVKAGKTIGRFIRKTVTSSSWRSVQQVSRELRQLPNKLMTESGLDEIEKSIGIDEINKEITEIQHDISDWTTPSSIAANDLEGIKEDRELNSTNERAIDDDPPPQSTPPA